MIKCINFGELKIKGNHKVFLVTTEFISKTNHWCSWLRTLVPYGPWSRDP